MAKNKITPKQAAFCREYLKDCNGTQAATRAGYSPRTANESASRLMTKAHVCAEIDRLQAEAAASAHVTVQTLLAEAEQARRVANEADNASAMVSATTLKAKLTGHLIEKTEDLVARAKLDKDMAQEAETKRAANLLAEAAESLGLERTATPAQIVGALAERPIATPEAFRLIREMGPSND